MQYNKEKIFEKAKKILTDLNPDFFKVENITKIVFTENDEVIKPVGKTLSTWTVIINEPIFDSSIFLIISDETGEPIYIQNKHTTREIEKDKNGNYKTIK